MCVSQKPTKSTRRSRCYQRYTELTMTTSNSIVSSQAHLPTEQKRKGRGDKIVEGALVKSKIGELDEEVRAGNSRRVRNGFTGVFQGVLWSRRLLLRFQNGCKNNLSSNQIAVVMVEKILVVEEPEVSKIPEITEDQVKKKKGYYLCVYVMLKF